MGNDIEPEFSLAEEVDYDADDINNWFNNGRIKETFFSSKSELTSIAGTEQLLVLAAGVFRRMSLSGLFVPSGVMMPYGGGTAPTGWLLCYGQEVSRTSLAGLFTAIGTNYGSGNGTTTFNLPDSRGRVLMGIDNLGGTAANRIQSSTNLTTTNASTSATVASATGIYAGMNIVCANVPDGTTVSAISGTTVTLSQAATAAGTVAARFSVFVDAEGIGSAGGHWLAQQHDHGGATGSGGGGGPFITSVTPTMQGRSTGGTDTVGAINTSSGNVNAHTHGISSYGGGNGQNIPPALLATMIIKT